LTATSGSPTRKKRIPRDTFTSIVTVTASIPVTALANVFTNIIPSLVAQKETLIKDKRNKIKDKRKNEKIASPALRDRNDSRIKLIPSREIEAKWRFRISGSLSLESANLAPP
jgi:hypothetical protein